MTLPFRRTQQWAVALATLSLTIACSAREAEAPAARAAGDLAYVTNEDSRELTVVDVTTDSVVATIPVGTRPRGVAVSPDGRTVYVALSGSPKCPPSMSDEECARLAVDKSQDGIAVVDVATRTKVKVLPAGSDPETFAVNPEGTRLFVSNEDADSASIIDLTTDRVIANVKVGNEPEGVTLQPDGKLVWVTGESEHDITGFDAATGEVVARIDVKGERPRSIGFLPDGSRAYTTNEFSSSLSVIDMKAHAVLRIIELPEGSRPMGIAVTPDGSRIYVSNGRGKTVSVIDPATDSVLATIEVGMRPWGIALSSDGTKLYTANGPGNDITVVDTRTMTVLKRLPAGKIPWGVAVGPRP
jgi:YVTN family beta-propeller protein